MSRHSKTHSWRRLRALGRKCTRSLSLPAMITGAYAVRWRLGLRISPGNLDRSRRCTGVSLEVRYGEIYGLLGANGAGKTTTIKMLCGLVAPTWGRVQLAGWTKQLRSSEVRNSIGYMSQNSPCITTSRLKRTWSSLPGCTGCREEREEKKRWVLEFSGLEGREQQLTGSLPQGWKQRVAFGSAIMHEPSVLFLDEPTSGVDPLARRSFWKMINRLADAGTAILVTTHYLEEAEQCNRLGLMVAGELVTEGTPNRHQGEQEGQLMEFVTDQPQRALDLLKNDTERWRVSLFRRPVARHS